MPKPGNAGNSRMHSAGMTGWKPIPVMNRAGDIPPGSTAADRRMKTSVKRVITADRWMKASVKRVTAADRRMKTSVKGSVTTCISHTADFPENGDAARQWRKAPGVPANTNAIPDRLRTVSMPKEAAARMAAGTADRMSGPTVPRPRMTPTAGSLSVSARSDA